RGRLRLQCRFQSGRAQHARNIQLLRRRETEIGNCGSDVACELYNKARRDSRLRIRVDAVRVGVPGNGWIIVRRPLLGSQRERTEYASWTRNIRNLRFHMGKSDQKLRARSEDLSRIDAGLSKPRLLYERIDLQWLEPFAHGKSRMGRTAWRRRNDLPPGPISDFGNLFD